MDEKSQALKLREAITEPSPRRKGRPPPADAHASRPDAASGFVDGMSDAALAIDGNRAVISVNSAFRRMFGLPDGDDVAGLP